VMNTQSIQPDEFVTAVKPLLEKRDMAGLISLLKSRWTAQQIVDLLKCRHCDARKVAALALSLVGGPCCLGPLSEQLKDPDPMVNEMAEHALWSIWFRSGNEKANCELSKGAKAMDRKEFECAVKHFTRAVRIDPKFAEAYNQRALARYMLERFEECAEDCEKVVELMPCHFGAWAGLGHCHAHEGRLEDALRCYERALGINPHLECLNEACEEIRRQMEGRGA
jgi:tetratricopeptide (TPR) repeat protein